MKTLQINPCNKDMIPIVRFRDQLKDYELASVIPESGFELKGKDVNALDGGDPTNVFFETNISTKEYDAYLLSIPVSSREEYKDCKEKCITFHTNQFDASEMEYSINQPLKEIPVPVIMILGLGENCQKFDLQLTLRKFFEHEGYKVSQLGTKFYSELFGFQQLLNLDEMSLTKKIYAYNTMIYDLYEAEQPDVVIVGVPGEIMPLNRDNNLRFGETALALATAVNPDIAILSTYVVNVSKQYIDMLDEYMRNRLGIQSVYYHMSSTQVKYNPNTYIAEYITINSDDVIKRVHQVNETESLALFHVRDAKSCDFVYQSILEKLQNNICVV